MDVTRLQRAEVWCLTVIPGDAPRADMCLPCGEQVRDTKANKLCAAGRADRAPLKSAVRRDVMRPAIATALAVFAASAFAVPPRRVELTPQSMDEHGFHVAAEVTECTRTSSRGTEPNGWFHFRFIVQSTDLDRVLHGVDLVVANGLRVPVMTHQGTVPEEVLIAQFSVREELIEGTTLQFYHPKRPWAIVYVVNVASFLEHWRSTRTPESADARRDREARETRELHKLWKEFDEAPRPNPE